MSSPKQQTHPQTHPVSPHVPLLWAVEEVISLRRLRNVHFIVFAANSSGLHRRRRHQSRCRWVPRPTVLQQATFCSSAQANCQLSTSTWQNPMDSSVQKTKCNPCLQWLRMVENEISNDSLGQAFWSFIILISICLVPPGYVDYSSAGQVTVQSNSA